MLYRITQGIDIQVARFGCIQSFTCFHYFDVLAVKPDSAVIFDHAFHVRIEIGDLVIYRPRRTVGSSSVYWHGEREFKGYANLITILIYLRLYLIIVYHGK